MPNTKNKIKLVIVVEATVGGIRKHIFDLVENLPKEKYSITLIYSSIRADKIFLKHVSNLSILGISLIKIEMMRNINPTIDLQSFIKLRKVLKQITPDILHLHAAKAGTLGRLAAISLGIKNIVYTPHGGSFHRFNERFGFIYKYAEKLLTLKSVHFIAVSQFAWLQYDKLLNVSEDRNHIIYNGISTNASEVLIYDNPFKEFECKDNDFILLVPAMFYEAKGHLQFLKALHNSKEKLNDSIKILFAGTGPLQNKIEDKIQLYGLTQNVKIIGFIENIYPLFKFADVILLPSQNEIFGYVILEAMAFGKPVIANAVDAIPELIKNDVNGILILSDKWIEFSYQLNYFIKHKDELDAMGLRGKKLLTNKFSLETMISKTDSLYSYILNSN